MKRKHDASIGLVVYCKGVGVILLQWDYNGLGTFLFTLVTWQTPADSVSGVVLECLVSHVHKRRL